MIYLADARRHLRIDGTQDDAEIDQKLLIANEMVLAYVGHQWGDYENPAYLPPYLPCSDNPRFRHGEVLDAARLLILGDLWQNRESGSGNPFSPAVVNLEYGHRS